MLPNIRKTPGSKGRRKGNPAFVVDEEGKMTHPKILQSVRYDIDKEAIRAFEAIADVHRWSPGYQDGEAKRVKFTIPYTSEYLNNQEIMANFIPKFPNLKYHLNNSMMERICELKERGYQDKDKYDYAPQDYADAMDSFDKVL